jgi:hypothetical protein
MKKFNKIKKTKEQKKPKSKTKYKTKYNKHKEVDSYKLMFNE